MVKELLVCKKPSLYLSLCSGLVSPYAYGSGHLVVPII